LRWLALVFLVLIAALQYPMWLGKGGWLQVRALDGEVREQRTVNAKLKERNDALDADVRDLKTGFDAIEERARSGLGMVRQDEIFFEFQQDARPAAAPAAGGAIADRSGAAGSGPPSPPAAGSAAPR
jgi:cell division protein FtsB